MYRYECHPNPERFNLLENTQKLHIRPKKIGRIFGFIIISYSSISLVVMFVFISILPRTHQNNLQNVILIYLTQFLLFQCELNSQLHISIVCVSVCAWACRLVNAFEPFNIWIYCWYFSFSGCLYCCHCATYKSILLHGALYYP